jgi:mRNA-degrading endonuclease YafQ of YafQ-DinJ toxin-antitoxin module
MPKTITVLEVEDPHFTITLYNDLLKIDLKGSFKNDLEEALENKPVLKETIGNVLGIFVPLHIRLSEVDAVDLDETGKIKLSLSYHRNVVIPFERKEDAEKLVEKLNQLISKAETEKIQESKARRRAEKEKIQVSKVRSRAERKRYRKRSDAERRV